MHFYRNLKLSNPPNKTIPNPVGTERKLNPIDPAKKPITPNPDINIITIKVRIFSISADIQQKTSKETR
jgi:hypothetical protein